MKKQKMNYWSGAQLLEGLTNTVGNVQSAASQAQQLLQDANVYSAYIKKYAPTAAVLFVALVLLTLTNTVLLIVKD